MTFDVQRPARCFVAAVAAVFLWSGAAQAQTTFQINSLGDTGQGAGAAPGQCWTGGWVGGSHECTLRAAIQAANQRSDRVTFAFNSTPSNPNELSSITIDSALPMITNRVDILGQTHPYWSEGRANVSIQGSASAIIQDYPGLVFGPGSDKSRMENIGIRYVKDAVVIVNADSITISNNYLAGSRANAGDTGRNGRFGILLSHAHSTIITNNIIRGNDSHGILIADASSGNAIQGNHFGVRPAGSGFLPEESSRNGGAGIFVSSTAGPNNALGAFAGNYFANNDEGAIQVHADGQLITANRIGLPPIEGVANNYEASDYGNRGEAAIVLASSDNQVFAGNLIGNADQIGILVDGSTNSNEITSNRIGLDEDDQPFGLAEGIELRSGSDTLVSGNTIAHSSSHGIYARAGSHSEIRSNRILDNSGSGIQMRGGGTIGGTSLAQANTIGNSGRGIFAFTNDAPVVIQNNYIGTNADAEDLGNGTGIQVQSNVGYVDIGSYENGNVIANSSNTGLFLASGANNVWIIANWIGVHPDGTAMGNTTGIGLTGSSAAWNNRIGYRASDSLPTPLDWLTDPQGGNIIAYNRADGVRVTGSGDAIGNAIRGNRFFANQGRDINLGMDHIDPGGSGSGPNTLLNWPQIDEDQTWLDLGTGQAQVAFSVNTMPANANYPLVVDFYLLDDNNPTRPVYVRSVEYPAATGAGNQIHSEQFAWPLGLPFSGHLVATATDGSNNTSQFSATPVALYLDPDGLGTTTANNGSGGIFLDLEASAAGATVSVTGFDLDFRGDAGTSVEVAVYVRDGSYVGEEANESAWTLHETMSYQRAGEGAFATATLAEAIEIEPGQLQGVYLQALSNHGIRYAGTNSAPPQTHWSDGTLNLFSDTATTTSSPFTGTLFTPRSFAGIVHYEARVEDHIFSDRFEE